MDVVHKEILSFCLCQWTCAKNVIGKSLPPFRRNTYEGVKDHGRTFHSVLVKVRHSTPKRWKNHICRRNQEAKSGSKYKLILTAKQQRWTPNCHCDESMHKVRFLFHDKTSSHTSSETIWMICLTDGQKIPLKKNPAGFLGLVSVTAISMKKESIPLFIFEPDTLQSAVLPTCVSSIFVPFHSHFLLSDSSFFLSASPPPLHLSFWTPPLPPSFPFSLSLSFISLFLNANLFSKSPLFFFLTPTTTTTFSPPLSCSIPDSTFTFLEHSCRISL